MTKKERVRLSQDIGDFLEFITEDVDSVGAEVANASFDLVKKILKHNPELVREMNDLGYEEMINEVFGDI